MDDTTWERVTRLREWLDENTPPDIAGSIVNWRVLKIAEEYGELTEALHGAVGANPRKGVSHSWEDVHKELSDVIVTALVALETSAPGEGKKLLDHRLQQLVDRVGA